MGEELTQEQLLQQHYYEIYSQKMSHEDASICARIVTQQSLYGSHNVQLEPGDAEVISRGNQAVGNWTPRSNYPRPDTAS